jgi:glyoxylase-like metal-dependent hydrolase (beta-lactamase superfamily II)
MVLIESFPAGPWQTNCWVVAPARGEQCVVIDPGYGAEEPLDDVLREHHLNPIAVILSHGHVDHTWSVVPVCGAKDVPAWIHPDDRAQLGDPLGAMGVPPGTPLFGRLTFGEPADVRELADGEVLRLAGLELAVEHAPGHTPGSVTFAAEGELFSGDLLFAGSIGRTDLPGGSTEEIYRSLAKVCLPKDDALVVRPGHGPTTTIGAERTSNPFLLDVAAASAEGRLPGGLTSPPSRGI